MSTMRYSGGLQIRITYLPPWGAGTPPPAGRSTLLDGEYRCFVRPIEPNDAGWRGAVVHVGTPVILTLAVDAPRAFDAVAHAALSFLSDEGWPIATFAALSLVEGEPFASWYVGRTLKKAWPTAASRRKTTAG